MSSQYREIECNATGYMTPWSEWRLRLAGPNRGEYTRYRSMVFGTVILFSIVQVTSPKRCTHYLVSACAVSGNAYRHAKKVFASFDAALEEAKRLVE